MLGRNGVAKTYHFRMIYRALQRAGRCAPQYRSNHGGLSDCRLGLLAYLPFLMVSGCIAGAFIGGCAQLVILRMQSINVLK